MDYRKSTNLNSSRVLQATNFASKIKIGGARYLKIISPNRLTNRAESGLKRFNGKPVIDFIKLLEPPESIHIGRMFWHNLSFKSLRYVTPFPAPLYHVSQNLHRHCCILIRKIPFILTDKLADVSGNFELITPRIFQQFVHVIKIFVHVKFIESYYILNSTMYTKVY